MIDCGLDWRRRLDRVGPRAIVITHGHPDHAFGLQDGAPCPVHATVQTWHHIEKYPIPDRHVIEPRSPRQIEGITFEAFSVEHSIRCPAVGYRVTTDGAAFFYVPDVVYIPAIEEALHGVRLFIGDGASMERGLVRRQGERIFGHAAVKTQLGWCAKHGVPEAVFTHCGTEVVGGDSRELSRKLRAWGRERRVACRFAYDGLRIELSGREAEQ
jgi:phosphoribosyl 1,2-cyclic phosphodiesterase